MSAYINNMPEVQVMDNTARESYNQDLKKSKLNSMNSQMDMNDSD